MAQMITRPRLDRQLDATFPSQRRRSVPVRLIRRVVDVFNGRNPLPIPRAVPARVVLVRTVNAIAAPVTELSRPRLPVRLLPRHRLGPDVRAAMAAAQPAALRAIPLPLRVAYPATRRRVRPHPAAIWYRLAITALLAGAVVTVMGPATFATFSSAVANSAVIATGTLVLGDTVNAATECFSFSGAGPNTIDSKNVNQACDNTWTVSGASAEPGQPIAAPQVAVVLHGSLTASTFNLYAPAACASSNTPGETYNGGSNICNVLQLYVQQYTSNAYSTPLKCLYGAGIATSTCTGFDATHTLADFGACHRATGSGACAGGEANGPLSIAVPVGPTPTGYFKILANLPLNVGNGYQGQAASVAFTWTIGQ